MSKREKPEDPPRLPGENILDYDQRCKQHRYEAGLERARRRFEEATAAKAANAANAEEKPHAETQSVAAQFRSPAKPMTKKEGKEAVPESPIDMLEGGEAAKDIVSTDMLDMRWYNTLNADEKRSKEMLEAVFSKGSKELKTSVAEQLRMVLVDEFNTRLQRIRTEQLVEMYLQAEIQAQIDAAQHQGELDVEARVEAEDESEDRRMQNSDVISSTSLMAAVLTCMGDCPLEACQQTAFAMIAEYQDAHTFSFEESRTVITMLANEAHRACKDCWKTIHELTDDYMDEHDYMYAHGGAAGGSGAGGSAAGGSAAGGSSRN